MQPRLSECLRAFIKGIDGIYAPVRPTFTAGQETEQKLREKVAAQYYNDYLKIVAQNHSIPVMDREVERFISPLPRDALILDIGGCWGWHWRLLGSTRPDITVVIIDFVRSNLIHARRLLGPLVDSQVALVHADATALPFDTAGETVRGFDGVWTVQVFQHIPDFDAACREARRVLRLGGYFVNFSLHDAPLYRAIYRIAGKTLHLDGMVDNAFHLTRANSRQRAAVAAIFGGQVTDRYTECLFHPNLGLSRSGRCGSWMGRLDVWLGNFPAVARWIARQRSFSTVKTH